MQAMIFTAPPHAMQVSMSMLKTRFKRCVEMEISTKARQNLRDKDLNTLPKLGTTTIEGTAHPPTDNARRCRNRKSARGCPWASQLFCS